MQTQTKVFIGISALVLVTVGINMSGGESDSSPVTQVTTNTNSESGTTNEPTAIKTETAEAEMVEEATGSNSESMDDSAMTSEVTEKVADVQPLAAGTYKTYSADAVENSNAESIVLSFHATWCPSCRTLDKDINASLSDIPAGTEIYKVDYDTNLELRKKYGVTVQHTHVVIDSDGNLIKKWTGSNTLEQFVAKI